MPNQKPKPKKPGRPVLPKNHARDGKIQARLNVDELKRVAAAAKSKDQTVSEFVRSTLLAAIER